MHMMTCWMVSWGFVYGLLLGNCRYQTERKKELWPKRNRTMFAILATKLITHFALGVTVAASMRTMKVLNIRNITWPCGDIKFLFDCWKIFYECRAQQVKYFSTQEVAMAKQLYVMFYLWYKHQRDSKSLHFLKHSFLLQKARFTM